MGTVIPPTMRDDKVCLTDFTECVIISIFDGFSTVYSGMNFCIVLRFFIEEAIFTKDELGSQSGSFLPATGYFLQEQRTNQSIIYYWCSGIIINGSVKCP